MTTATTNVTTFEVGRHISINFSGAFVMMVHLTIIHATTKAIQVRNDDPSIKHESWRTCWIPKAALIEQDGFTDGGVYKFVKWFAMNRFQQHTFGFLE